MAFNRTTLASIALFSLIIATLFQVWVFQPVELERAAPGQCWTGNERSMALSHVDGLKSDYQLEEMFEGPGLASTESHTRAACKFTMDDHTSHWPHAMQQLYRCFSWWGANPGAEHYLILNPDKQPLDSEFLRGFIERLRDIFGVKVINLRKDLKVVRSIISYAFDEMHSFAMRKGDSAILRDSIINYYNIPMRYECNAVPRILILNRKNERVFENLAAMVRSIEDAFGDNVTCTVTEFEAAGFQEQVQSLYQTDILVTPHGAQLTGIPFLPRCAHVLEFFPAGYFVPAYFGSLAAVSNVKHSYMYLGKNQRKELRVGMKTVENRETARSSNICPRTHKVIEALATIMDEWKQCCHEI